MRNHRTAAWLAGALATALAGCGTAASPPVGTDPSPVTPPKALTVYTDLPLGGPAGAIPASIENGARLALEQSGHGVHYGPRGHVRWFWVNLRALSDADPATGTWSQDLTVRNAQDAASRPTTVAYIGDFESAATAISLQAISPSGILQISPWSPYIGFTDANPADGKGDPARFYPPSGQNTFARLVPSDVAEAQATVNYMASLGVTRLYVFGDVSVFDAAIAQLVANDAPKAGIAVVAFQPGLDTQTNTQPTGYAQIVRGVAALRPDAVLLGGTPGAGAVALWDELHALLPQAKLFAPSTLATPTFLRGIAGVASAAGTTGATGATNATGTTDAGSTSAAAATSAGSATPTTGASGATAPTSTTSAASATYVTSPILAARQYPAAAQSVFAAYRRRFKTPPTPYALYGYEAMRDVLAAIRQTGRQSTNRTVLLRVFFHHLGVIHGTIGDYTINGYGDTSLARFDGYRVSGGALVAPRPIP